MIMRNKKGFGLMSAVLIGFSVLALIYIILLLPVPLFTLIRRTFNYALLIGLWALIQVGFIAMYWEIGKFGGKSVMFVKTKIMKWSLNIRNYILTHN